MGLEQLYVKCMEERKALPLNESLVPVCEYKGSKLEKIGKGTTRIPQFDVVDWIARPAGMDAGSVEEVAAPAPAPAPAPVAKTAAQRAVEENDDEMF
jgi:hypothetical protein